MCQFKRSYKPTLPFSSALILPLSQLIECLFERKTRKRNVRDWRAVIEGKSQ
jgi:hypothetical protein